MAKNRSNTKPIILSALSPGKGLMGLTIIYLICGLLATRYLLDRPYSNLILESSLEPHTWIATNLGISGETIVISELKADILSMGAKQIDLTSDPEVFATYHEYNRFMNRQQLLSRFFQFDTWNVTKNNGTVITHHLTAGRPISTLPLGFWVNMIAGSLCLLIGASIWLNKRGKLTSLIILAGGVALAVAGVTAAVYSSRDLALPELDFRLLHVINRFSMATFAASMLSLLWVQPIRLGSGKLVPVFYGWQWLHWLNETLQIIEWPVHTYYPVQFQVPFFVCLFLIGMQWSRSKKKPVERAQLTWFFISILLSSGTAIFLYTVPIVMGYEPIIPLWLGNVVILLLYLGFILGILRYRLFDVQQWWIATWFWFGIIILVIVFDALLIYWLNVQSDLALGVSLFIAMWIYLPIRSLFWEKLAGQKYSDSSQSKTLEKMLDIFESDNQDPHSAFKSWLVNYFKPVVVEHSLNRCASPYLTDHGLQIILPGLEGDSWLVKGKNKGLELFNIKDLRMVNLLWKIYSHALNLINNREQVELRERKRIMRDLHDDVGAKLLTLVHSCKDPAEAELARNTLSLLRQTVVSLRENNSKNIFDALLEWKSEVQSRLDIAAIKLDWEHVTDSSDQTLSAREYLNMSKIIREAVNNILRHANATEVKVKLAVETDKLVMIMEHDGTFSDPSTWEPGTGVENIRTRAAEIGAATKWQVFNHDNIQRLQFHCSLPFGAIT